MKIKIKEPLDDKKVAQQERRWRRAIVKMEKVVPFWAYHAERLNLVMCRGWNKTAAVDGVNLFWNPEFTAGLNDKQLMFLLAHEVFHVAAGHLWRGQRYFQGRSGAVLHRNIKRWNHAADYAIHQILVPLIDSGDYKEMQFIKTGLYDVKYAGKGVETIYTMLKAEQKKKAAQAKKGDPGQGTSGGSGSGEGDSGNGEGSGESGSGSGEAGDGAPDKGESEESTPGDSESGEGTSEGGGGDESGEGQTIDAHIVRGEGELPEGAIEGDDGSWVLIVDQDGNPITPSEDDPQPEPMDPRGLRRQVQRDINDRKLEDQVVAQGNGTGRGKGGKGVVKKVDPVIQSQQNWDILKRFILQCAEADYSYARPNRSYLARGLIIPGLRSSALKIAIAIDTSSSIDKVLLTRFASEVEGIRSQLGDHEIELITCSTYIPYDYITQQKQTQIVRTGEAIDWNIEVGGGTNFCPVFDYIQEQGDRPACLLFFTDLDGDFPQCAPEYPVLWAVPNNTYMTAPWGEVVKLDTV